MISGGEKNSNNFTFSEQRSCRGVDQLLHDEESVALHETSFNLSDINAGVERLPEVHHDVGLENLNSEDCIVRQTGRGVVT